MTGEGSTYLLYTFLGICLQIDKQLSAIFNVCPLSAKPRIVWHNVLIILLRSFPSLVIMFALKRWALLAHSAYSNLCFHILCNLGHCSSTFCRSIMHSIMSGLQSVKKPVTWMVSVDNLNEITPVCLDILIIKNTDSPRSEGLRYMPSWETELWCKNHIVIVEVCIKSEWLNLIGIFTFLKKENDMDEYHFEQYKISFSKWKVLRSIHGWRPLISDWLTTIGLNASYCKLQQKKKTTWKRMTSTVVIHLAEMLQF